MKITWILWGLNIHYHIYDTCPQAFYRLYLISVLLCSTNTTVNSSVLCAMAVVSQSFRNQAQQQSAAQSSHFSVSVPTQQYSVVIREIYIYLSLYYYFGANYNVEYLLRFVFYKQSERLRDEQITYTKCDETERTEYIYMYVLCKSLLFGIVAAVLVWLHWVAMCSYRSAQRHWLL